MDTFGQPFMTPYGHMPAPDILNWSAQELSFSALKGEFPIAYKSRGWRKENEKRLAFSKPICKVKFTLEWVIVELELAHLGHTGWCCWSHCSPCCRNSGQTEHCGLGNLMEGSEAWHSNKGLSEHLVAMLEQKALHNLTPEKRRIWEGRNNNQRKKMWKLF